MTIPIGADWSETQATVTGPVYSFPLLRAAVRLMEPVEDPMGESLHSYGPPDAFMLREVAIPNATRADYDNLMDQIVALIDTFAQPFLSPGVTTSTEKIFFQRPAQIVEGS